MFCPDCKSDNVIVEKAWIGEIVFLHCLSCSTTRTVGPESKLSEEEIESLERDMFINFAGKSIDCQAQMIRQKEFCCRS